MKLGIISVDEPFGLYTLRMSERDSLTNIRKFNDKQFEKRTGTRAFSIADISLGDVLLYAGLISAFSLHGTLV